MREFSLSTFSIVVVVIIGIIAILFGIYAFYCGIIPNDESKNTSIILGFVGILATFVVLSNYLQVKEIENKTKKQIEDFKNKISLFENNLTRKVLDYEKNKMIAISQEIEFNIIKGRYEYAFEILFNNYSKELDKECSSFMLYFWGYGFPILPKKGKDLEESKKVYNRLLKLAEEKNASDALKGYMQKAFLCENRIIGEFEL